MCFSRKARFRGLANQCDLSRSYFYNKNFSFLHRIVFLTATDLYKKNMQLASHVLLLTFHVLLSFLIGRRRGNVLHDVRAWNKRKGSFIHSIMQPFKFTGNFCHFWLRPRIKNHQPKRLSKYKKRAGQKYYIITAWIYLKYFLIFARFYSEIKHVLQYFEVWLN